MMVHRALRIAIREAKNIVDMLSLLSEVSLSGLSNNNNR